MTGYIYSINEIKERVVPIAQKYGVTKVVLFGSYARGEATEKSDIDLAIEKGEQLKNYRIYSDFYHELLDTFEKEIDLLTFLGLQNGNQKLKQSIDKEGICIYGNK